MHELLESPVRLGQVLEAVVELGDFHRGLLDVDVVRCFLRLLRLLRLLQLLKKSQDVRISTFLLE